MISKTLLPLSFRFVPAALALLMLPVGAPAFCGLASCPRIDPHAPGRPFEAGLRTRLVSFDMEGESGYYGVVSPRFFAKAGGVGLGVEVPWVTLRTDDDAASGLGNPLLMAQYSRRISHLWSAEAGVQLELPLGDADHGLADDHTMLLPWVGARKEWGAAWYTSGMLGFSQALEKEADEPGTDVDTLPAARLAKVAHEGHEHGGELVPLLVNPHGDRELQGRLGLGWMRGRSTLEGFALAQADLSEAETVYYARLGVSWEWALTASVGLQAIADAPVTSARRSDGEIGVGIKIGW